MIRTVGAAVAAVAALAVSLGYFYVLNDGYAQPTDIAGTLFRFAGSTGTILLILVAFSIAFPELVRSAVRRWSAAAIAVGWILIELGAMAFSLSFDYEHLSQDVGIWGDIQGYFFVGGYALLVAGLALFLVLLRKPSGGGIAASIVISVFGVLILLVLAVVLRYVLFVVPIATLIVVILVPLLRGKRAFPRRLTTAG